MKYVSSSSTAADFAAPVADLSLLEVEFEVGKNKDSLADFVAKRLKENSHCLMS